MCCISTSTICLISHVVLHLVFPGFIWICMRFVASVCLNLLFVYRCLDFFATESVFVCYCCLTESTLRLPLFGTLCRWIYIDLMLSGYALRLPMFGPLCWIFVFVYCCSSFTSVRISLPLILYSSASVRLILKFSCQTLNVALWVWVGC